jgi:hypothetical protein
MDAIVVGAQKKRRRKPVKTKLDIFLCMGFLLDWIPFYTEPNSE